MTLKKGIKLLDLWIEDREKKLKVITAKVIKENAIETDIEFEFPKIYKAILENEKNIIENLKLIRKEIVPNCKHPKNMRDTCKGVVYCMDCNLDL